MNHIEKKLKAARQCGKKLFVPFITAGYPDLRTTERLLYMFDEEGADVVELGIPFSDPLADGPVIQHASQLALARGTTVRKVLALVKKVRPRVDCGIILFGALNPFLRYGLDRFVKDAARAGADGLLIPDCPPEESREVFARCRQYRLSNILLVSPTTGPERITAISRRSHPFVYCISVKGVTGVRKGVSKHIGQFLGMVRQRVTRPFVVGFGISTPADVKAIARYSDGVVVGSGFIKKIMDRKGDRQVVSRLRAYCRSLAAACKG